MEFPPMVSFTKTYHNKPYPFISPDRPELSAAGKNVVIAGGGTGIGKATAIAFAQAGASSVSILGRRVNRLDGAAKEIRSAGPQTTVICEQADFSQREKAEDGLKAVVDKVGKIDVFVWSAGVLPQVANLKGYNGDEFRRGMEIIIMGAFNAIQALLPLAAPNAQVFNISTGIAHIKPVHGVFAYAANKAAVAKMFDFLATEHPELHVVNIQPGIVSTELNSENGVEGQDERKSSPQDLPSALM